MKIFEKLGEIFVDKVIVKKTLAQFWKINFHVLRIRATKSWQKQEINLENFDFLKYVSTKVVYIPTV